MPYPNVTRVKLRNDNHVEIDVEATGFDSGATVHVTGVVSQTNNAHADVNTTVTWSGHSTTVVSQTTSAVPWDLTVPVSTRVQLTQECTASLPVDNPGVWRTP